MEAAKTFFLFSLVVLASCTSTDRARLLASKKLHNTYLVENADMVIEYSLFNIGTAPALNVQLADGTFNSEHFDIVAGQPQVKFDRIAPSANVSHTIVVRPKQYGYFNFTAAVVTYLPSEESKDVQIGYTSFPGEGGIIPQREFQRRFSPHLFDWAVFVMLAAPLVGVPFMMWFNINNKYQLGLSAVKAK